jgi:hypothetical protein
VRFGIGRQHISGLATALGGIGLYQIGEKTLPTAAESHSICCSGSLGSFVGSLPCFTGSS